jgi:hypothetical protein
MSEMTITEQGARQLQELIATLATEVDSLREALDAQTLELALEDREWRRLIAGAPQEFSKPGIDRISQLARLMAIKNPLVKRALKVQGSYVFGQGVTLGARHAELQPVMRRFVDLNRDQLFGLQAQLLKDKELACDGNLFLALFTDPLSGAVRVRTIPLEQIVDVVTDPEDRQTVWYYKRSWVERTVDRATGAPRDTTRTAYYPDWRYRPRTRPPTWGDQDVAWDTPLYHVAVGAFSDWTWGLSEVYAAIDWARAYKEFLEDWATITRALSRFAWKRATRGTSKAVQAAKRQMATTLGTGTGQGETNPPATVGAVAVLGEGEDLEPMRTSGATTKMEDGRRLLLMVAAATNLPETFFGDSAVGTLATAKSLDRPTELAMSERQQLWREIYADLCDYALREAVRAASRRILARPELTPLRQLGRVERVDDTSEEVVWATDPVTGKPVDATVVQTWPPIVEIDPGAEVDTVMAAAPALPDPRLIAQLLLQALRVADADDVLERLFPTAAPERAGPPAPPTAPTPAAPAAAADPTPPTEAV